MATFFDDTFTGSSGTNLSSHTPDTGTSWTQIYNTGSTGIELSGSGTCQGNNSLSDGAVYVADATYSSADYEVVLETTIVDSGDDPSYIGARIDSSTDYGYYIEFNEDKFVLYSYTSGSGWTSLDSSATHPVDGDTIKLEVIGTSIKGYINGTEYLSATNSDHTSAGQAGLGIGSFRLSGDDQSGQEHTRFSVSGFAELEQEGFAFGDDDGSESAHTLDTQDTNITEALGVKTVRALIDATGDPATNAYTLKYQKDGSGGYEDVPTSSTSPDIVTEGFEDASFPPTNFAHVTGDDANWTRASDQAQAGTYSAKSGSITDDQVSSFEFTAPAAYTNFSFYWKVSSEEGFDYLTWYINDVEQSQISGEVGWVQVSGVSLSQNDVVRWTYSKDGSVNEGSDAGWVDVVVYDAGTTSNNEVYVSASSNVTAGGEATTARLTAPSGKTTSDFDTGRRWDDENGSDSVDITNDDYTELEWVLTTQSTAAVNDYFEFRVYGGGDASLNTYTVTPKWTIGTAATTYSKANSAKANILATYSKDTSAKANIEITGEQPSSVKANVLGLDVTLDHAVKANILDSYTSDNQSKANIVVTESDDVSAKANVIVDTTVDNLVRAYIFSEDTILLYVKANILNENIETENQLKANILAEATDDNQSKANVLRAYDKALEAKANIEAIGQQSNYVKANIFVENTIQNNATKASITSEQTNDNSALGEFRGPPGNWVLANVKLPSYSYAKANIVVTEENNNSVKADLLVTNTANSSNKGNILETYEKPNSAKANFLNEGQQPNSTTGNIIDTYTRDNRVKANVIVDDNTISNYVIGNIVGYADNYVRANLITPDIVSDSQVKGNILRGYEAELQTKANILVENTNDNNVKADILRTIEDNQFAKGNILTTYTSSNQSKADILVVDNVANNSSVGNISHLKSQDLRTKANILNTYEAENSVKGNVPAEHESSSQANILVETSKDSFAKANILKAGNSPQYVTGNILTEYIQENTVKANIIRENTYEIQSKSNIRHTYTANIQAKANILHTYSQDDDVTANLLVTDNITDNFVRANIFDLYSIFNITKANILNTYTQENNVKGNVPAEHEASTKANIIVDTSKDSYVKADILKLKNSPEYVVGNILTSYEYESSAKANIITPNLSSQNRVRANIKNTYEQSPSVKANILTDYSASNYIKADIIVTTTFDGSSKANIVYKQSANNSVRGNILRIDEVNNNNTKANIVVTEINAQSVKADIIVTSEIDASSKANLTRFGLKFPNVVKGNILVTDKTRNNVAKASIVVTHTHDNFSRGNFFYITTQDNAVRAQIRHVQIYRGKPYQTRSNRIYRPIGDVYGRRNTEV